MQFKENEVYKLEKWLLDRYTSSAFNICTHQILKKMAGPPLKPWHFREQVKECLYADCRMGVLEEVAEEQDTEEDE